MSYLLNPIDNNRSEDDEDDHINKLFLRCKPRASSLSLSPSLQQIIPHHHNNDSPSSTSASDLCLNSSQNLSSPNFNKEVHNNNNNNTNNSNNNSSKLSENTQKQRYSSSSSRRHSTNNSNNKCNDKNGINSSSSQQSLWSAEDFTIFSSEQAQLAYKNNNIVETTDKTSDNYLWANSCESLNHLSGGETLSPFSVKVDQGQSYRSIPLKHKKCENNHHTINHNSCESSRGSRKSTGNITSSPISFQQQSTCNSEYSSQSTSIYFSPTASNSKVEQEIKQNNKTQISSEINLSSSTVISYKPQDVLVGLCSAKSAAVIQPSSKILLAEPQRKMEQHHQQQHSIQDNNFDNGIGSRSSGESNKSDIMENLVSPRSSSRVVASGSGVCGGIKGHSTSTTTPSSAPALVPSTMMGSLRDSRIEIAGGREIYSQNRIRASRRHRGSSSSHAISSNEMMPETVPSCVLPSTSTTKMRKKSLHSHNAPYHHHCCHNSTSSCCGGPSANNCAEVTLPPHGSLVWEPNNHNHCRRGGGTTLDNRHQQYLSHSHSFGGTAGGCCGHHGSFDYQKLGVSPDFEGVSNNSSSRLVRNNIPTNLHKSSPTSPMTVRETIFASEIRSIEKSTPRGSTLVSLGEVEKSSLLHGCELEPVIYESVAGLGDGGKVVFDDIGEWRERDNGGYEGGDEQESQNTKKRQMQAAAALAGISSISSKDREIEPTGSSFSSYNNSDIISLNNMQQQRVKRTTTFGVSNTVELSENSPCASNRDGNTTPSGYESDECSASACTNTSTLSANVSRPNKTQQSPNFGNKRLIGSIPIAEYEGSPKRYGLKQTVHPVTTHFDLIDVNMGGVEMIHNNNKIRRENDQIINDPNNSQTPLDQTMIATTTTNTTSSSSSSLDNTNTNVSSNSSSRTNNRGISPRVLSPSHPISAFSAARFPGFPQRVTTTASLNLSQESSNNTQQTSCLPLLLDESYSVDSNNLVGTNHELLSSVNNDLTNTESHISNNKMKENEMGHLSNSSCSTMTSYSNNEQLIRMQTSPPLVDSDSTYNNSSSTSDQHTALLQCNLLEDNFLIDSSPSLIVRSSSSGGPDPCNQDFLYEFSETRKVLEEFFNVAASSSSPGSSCRVGGGARGGGGPFLADKASFDELDYMLKRQTGNSKVGQRLASDIVGNLVTEESPKKPPRRGVLLLGSSDGDGSDEKGSPKLISFQEISFTQPQLHSPQLQLQHHQLHHYHHHPQQQHPQKHQYHNNHRPSQSLTTCSSVARSPRVSLKTHSRSQSQSPPLHDPTRDRRDFNDNDIDVETASTNTETDLGETEVGLQVGRGRNFAVSPETTDCDSNELESELSLDYEASLHSSCRVGEGKVIPPISQRPMVTDNDDGVGCARGGLSSGNNSDNEDIIEVDVGDDCYLMNNSKIAKQGPKDQSKLLYSTDENKENILELVTNSSSEINCTNANINVTSNILSWSNAEDLILNIQDEGGSSQSNSSGDPNPTLMLMKKQISEIEKEIQLRASQQSQSNNKSQSNGTVMGDGNLVLDSEIDMNEKIELPLSGVESASSTNSTVPNTVTCSSSNNSNSRQLNGKHEGILEETMVSRKNPFAHMEVHDSGQEHQESPPSSIPVNHDVELDALDPMRPTPPPSPAPGSINRQQQHYNHYPQHVGNMWKSNNVESGSCKAVPNIKHHQTTFLPSEITGGYQPSNTGSSPPTSASVNAAIQDIKEAIQRAKPLPHLRQPTTTLTTSSSISNNGGFLDSQQQPQSPLSQEHVPLICDSSPVWVPRNPRNSDRNRDPRADSQGAKDPLLKKQRYDDRSPEDDANTDTDTETDRLLGQTRTEDDCGFFDEKDWKKPVKSRSLLPSLNFVKSTTSPSQAPLLSTSASILGGGGSISSSAAAINNSFTNANNVISSSTSNNASSSSHLIHPLSPTNSFDDSQVQLSSSSTGYNKSKKDKDVGAKKKRSKEDFLKNPSVLIEGVLFRARYLGSTQLTCEGQPTKATRMMQAEEAVSRIKAESSNVNDANELQQGPALPSVDLGPSSSYPTFDSTNLSSSTTNTTTIPSNELENSKVCSLNMSKNVGEVGARGKEMNDEIDDYYYGQDADESCDGQSDVDEDLFLKAAIDKQEMRLPLEDNDNHAHPLSLHHNRQSSSGNGETCSSGQPTLSPPCASATPGTMFRLKFVGSLEVDEEIGNGKRRRKRPKKIMVEEAVMKLKSMAPEGETQPSTEVDLFISTEKIMVLNTDLKEIMMDHALRTISYIADIGDLVVLMARRRPVPSDPIDDSKPPRPPKMICHVFESDEAQYIAQSIGQAFQVAYMEFLKANGIEDSSFVREMDYQEVLNSQEIFGDELQMFAKKELQKEVVVPKSKGEILGVVIVESGWGSMLPTVVIANLAPAGAAARCGHVNIGDQIIAINGVSLVGLPLSTCQNYIKNTKNQTVVKLTVVPCPPVVEVKIKRPDTKYQLGFSVQNGVICSLLRGGIAERGGVRVGHRIIEINSQSVVAVPHEKIVNLLATSVGEINMKTMPTSMFRLLTGQENPLYI